jgi:hypothetical protein
MFIKMLKSMPGVKSIADQMTEECPLLAPKVEHPPSLPSKMESTIPESETGTSQTSEVEPVPDATTQAVDAEADEIRSNIQKLNDMFIALKNAICSKLEYPKDGREPISASYAVDKIITSPTADREPHETKILNEERTELRKSNNIQGVLDCLVLLGWDYLNPDIYGDLIVDFSLHSLDGQLAEYREKLQKFMDETPITAFSAVVQKKKRMIPDGFKELVTRHNWKSPVYLKEVEKFRQAVASQYGLKQCAVFLVALGKGSVIVSLFMPTTAEGLIKSTKPEFFMKHNITTMTFDGSLVTSEGPTVLRASEKGNESRVTSALQSVVDPNSTCVSLATMLTVLHWIYEKSRREV